MTGRIYGGIISIFVALVIGVFLATANYSALGSHPGRIWVPVILGLIVALPVTLAVRLLRSSRRGG